MAGLGEGQRQAQHLVSHIFHLLQGARGLDASALAPAAGVDLNGRSFKRFPPGEDETRETG